MHAMVLKSLKTDLEFTERSDRLLGTGEIRVKVTACGVCRNDLHIVDGELRNRVLPIIPGHEIVGRIDQIGSGVEHCVWANALASLAGPYLRPYCRAQRENPAIARCSPDPHGRWVATSAVADARYAFHGEAR
jgi:propanol-preferring alcohol dehydrogenase